MQYYANHGNFEQSIAYGQAIYAVTFCEEIHRNLMRIYLESGTLPCYAAIYPLCQPS